MVLGLAAVLTCGSAAMAGPTQRDVVFAGGGGVQIAGTLVLPDSTGPGHQVPGMLLIQGSGPTDRNGNQPPGLESNLLGQLADMLAAAGVASLRYDKRGMYANQATLLRDRAEWGSFFSWSAFVDDARAAFAFLAAQPDVAGDRVGVLGHSEGGLIALDLARRTTPPPKLLVLASTPGRSLGEVIQDQLAALLDRQHATPLKKQFFLDADRRVRQEILATGQVPANVPPGLAALYPPYLGSFLSSELTLDPVALATEFKGPILVVNGTADAQVPATRDAPRFAAMLASRPESEVFTPMLVSHHLKPSTGDDDPGIAGDVATSVQDKLFVWLKAHL